MSVNIEENELLKEVDHWGDFGLNDNWDKNYNADVSRGFTRFCVDCGKGLTDNAVCILVANDTYAIRADVSVQEAATMFDEMVLALMPIGKTCAKKLAIPAEFQRVVDFDNPNGTGIYVGTSK